ncbi:EF-hand domain-containing protein (plasmid) [Thioclava litoralis]|uniref:EF-hand domain-containing protein n=1 Tax=Thioclava litoralis TaxID=3076557 RepID=A0ABZ1E6D4_9RHOB|nr:EF-hand domain-containing protein [Thioclava sp. FTW29]
MKQSGVLPFGTVALAALLACGPVVSTQALAQTKPPAREANEPPRPPSLKEMDRNHDGRVTVKEFDMFMAEHAPRPDGPPPSKSGHAAPKGAAPKGKADHPRPPSGAELDRNHDGIISKKEFKAFLAKMTPPKPQR